MIRFLLFCPLILVAQVVAAAEGMRHFDELSPALASALREARAETEREAARSKEPGERSERWGRLGMLYHAQHLPFAAEEAYGLALAEADDPRWRYLRAIARSERGDLAAALTDYQGVVAADPDNVAAHYRLGAALLVKGELDAAQAALEAARKLDPEAAIVLMALADLAAAREQWEMARALLEQARKRAPEAGQLAYKLAMIHRRLGNVAEARAWLDRRGANNSTPEIEDPVLLEVAMMSRSGRFFMKAGEWAMERGDHEQALEAYANAVQLAPDDSAAMLAYIHALSQSGSDEAALREARQFVEREADSAEGWYLLAWLLRYEPSGIAEASAAVSRALNLGGSDAARNLAAGFAMRAGSYGKAATDYQALRETNPNNAYYHFWHGVAMIGDGDCRGRASVSRALELERTWGEAHLVLARADALCGASDAARRRAVGLLKARDDADTRITLAFAELGAGERKAARRLAEAELPHADARLLIEALDRGQAPAIPFAPESPWWLPPEVRPRADD